MHKDTKAKVYATVIIAGTLAGGIILGYDTHAVVDKKVSQNERITEDSPNWDCHTMGNKICGTFDVPGSVRQQVIQGHSCSLEPDFNDRTGDVYAAWYCK